MALTNPNWGRWIAATLAYAFNTEFSSSDYKLVVDGQIVKESTTEKGQLELRVDGPIATREISKGYFYLEGITVNLHAQVYNCDDLYEDRRVSGLMEIFLGTDRCVYRYGLGVDDDQTLVGGLVLQTRGRLDGIKTHYFGKEENENFEQLSVEANYNMYLNQGD